MRALQIAAYAVLAVCWVAWSLAFIKPQKSAAGKKKAVRAPASRVGILLVMLGYACEWALVRPVGFEKSTASLIAIDDRWAALGDIGVDGHAAPGQAVAL